MTGAKSGHRIVQVRIQLFSRDRFQLAELANAIGRRDVEELVESGRRLDHLPELPLGVGVSGSDDSPEFGQHPNRLVEVVVRGPVGLGVVRERDDLLGDERVHRPPPARRRWV